MEIKTRGFCTLLHGVFVGKQCVHFVWSATRRLKGLGTLMKWYINEALYRASTQTWSGQWIHRGLRLTKVNDETRLSS